MNPRFGLLRSKQFLMNDLYSFDSDQVAAQKTYHQISQIYESLFTNILGFKDDVLKVEANPGAMGGNLSHEFHLPNPSAEDNLLICNSCGHKSKKDEVKNHTECEECGKNSLKTVETVEVGHTFQLGDKYSTTFGVSLSVH